MKKPGPLQKTPRLLAISIGVAVLGCAPGHLESFPPPVRPGVDVHQQDYRLQEAVVEYIQFRNLPFSPEQMRTGVTSTEWFPVHELEVPPTPLAICPGPPDGQGQESEYRARYRFSVLPRGGFRLLKVEAHWQKALPGVDPDGPRWTDCRSTGAWERETEDRIILRARLLSQRYRGEA